MKVAKTAMTAPIMIGRADGRSNCFISGFMPRMVARAVPLSRGGASAVVNHPVERLNSRGGAIFRLPDCGRNGEEISACADNRRAIARCDPANRNRRDRR